MSILTTPTGVPFSQMGSSNAFFSRSSTLPLSNNRISIAFGSRDSGSVQSGARQTPRSRSPGPVPGTGFDALRVWDNPLTAPIPRVREMNSVDGRFAASGLSIPMASSTGSNYAPNAFNGYYERQVGDVRQSSTSRPTSQKTLLWPHETASRSPTPPPGRSEILVSDTIEALKSAGLQRLDRLETGLADIRGQLAELCSRRAVSQKGTPEGPRFDDLDLMRSRNSFQQEESIAVQELRVAHHNLVSEHSKRQDRLNRLEDQLQSLLPLEVQLPRARQELREAEDRERTAREEVAELSAFKKWATATADDGAVAATELAQMSTELDRHRTELERVRCELRDARGDSESAAAEARFGRDRSEMLELEVQRLLPLEQQLKETTEELNRVTEESKSSQAELQMTQQQLSSAEARWAALRVELANAQKELSSRAAARGEVFEDSLPFGDLDGVLLQSDVLPPTIPGSGELARAREELAFAEEERNRIQDRIQQERAAAAAAFLAEVDLQDALESGLVGDAPEFNPIDETSGFNAPPAFDGVSDKALGFADVGNFNGNADSNGFGDVPVFDGSTTTAFGNTDDATFRDATNVGSSNDIAQTGFGDQSSSFFNTKQEMNGFTSDDIGVVGGDSQWVSWSGEERPKEPVLGATTQADDGWQNDWAPWAGDDNKPQPWGGDVSEQNALQPSEGGYADGLQSDSSSTASEDSITPSQSASRCGSPKLQSARKQEKERSPQTDARQQLSNNNPYRAAVEPPGLQQDRKTSILQKIKQQSHEDFGGYAAPSSPSGSQRDFSWAQGSRKQNPASGSAQFPNGGVASGNSRTSKASSSGPDVNTNDLSWAQGKRQSVGRPPALADSRRASQFSFSAGANESMRGDSRETGGRPNSLQGSSGGHRNTKDKAQYSPSNPFADPLPGATSSQGGFSPLNPFATA